MDYSGHSTGNAERGTINEEAGNARDGWAVAGDAVLSSAAAGGTGPAAAGWNIPYNPHADIWSIGNLAQLTPMGMPQGEIWTADAPYRDANLADGDANLAGDYTSESGSSDGLTTNVSESMSLSDAPADLNCGYRAGGAPLEPVYLMAPSCPPPDADSSSESGSFFTEFVGSSSETSENERESFVWEEEVGLNPALPMSYANEPADFSNPALLPTWGVDATSVDEQALHREAPSGSFSAPPPADAIIGNQDLAIILHAGVSPPVTATGAIAATTEKADQIQIAVARITERPTTRDQRQQVWKWAEMLLETDDIELMRRPFTMPRPFGVYREDTPTVRRRQKSATEVPDKWINSGGTKGSTEWPLDETGPRLRCQYGKVVPKGVLKHQPLRYHLYTFTKAGAVANSGVSGKLETRRLYVVFSSGDEASDIKSETAPGTIRRRTNTKPPMMGGHPAVHLDKELKPVGIGGHATVLDVQALVSLIDKVVAELEHQAQPGAAASELDAESVVKLILLLTDLPEDAQRSIARYERPSFLEYPMQRYVFVEIDAGKRRTDARYQRKNHGEHGRGLKFDKWLNGGGKRAVVEIETTSGWSLHRRAGRVSRSDGADGTSGIDLRYHQYTLKPATTAPKNSRTGVPTIFHVRDRSRASSNLAAAAAQTKKSKRKDQKGQPVSRKRPEEMLLTLEGRNHPSKRQKNAKSATVAGLTALAVVLYVGAVYAFEGSATQTDRSSFDIGECAPGFFLSSSYGSAPEDVRECFPRADHTICDQYTEAMQSDAGAESEVACVESCASMGTDSCDAISYNPRSQECKGFRSCAGTVTDPNSIDTTSWATVWLRAADQPDVQQQPGEQWLSIQQQPGEQWSISCYVLTSRVAKQPRDSRCMRCDDCGGDYNILLPCTSSANTVCTQQEESWDLVTDATVLAGNLSEGLELLSPPQYAATWQTDAAIYAFGGSESYWPDNVPSDGTLERYTNIRGVANSLWKLDRSRAPHVSPRWTQIVSGGMNYPALWPAARTAAASWTVGRDSGMIFSGQFDLNVNIHELKDSAQPGSFFVPPNSIFRFDNIGAQWRLLGGVDTWQLLQKAELAAAFSNGFLETTAFGALNELLPVAYRRWPLPRSQTQTFSLFGVSYMFSGVFQMVDATTVGHEDQWAGRRPFSAQARSFLLNDFWVIDANADYESNRIPVATLIATCGTVVERPDIIPRGGAYPGPRRGAATWSASIDDRTRSGLSERTTSWVERGWMFGGIGRRISTSGTAPAAPVGTTKPRAGGAYSCVAEQLSDDGKSSPEVALVTNLCDLWAFSPRSGWVLVYACPRDAKLLYLAGVAGVALDVFPSSPQRVPLDAWAAISGPPASFLSTTWVEYDEQQTSDAAHRGSLTRHFETTLRMFGGVTRCATRRPVVRDSNGATTALNFSHQLVTHTMCDVLDEETAAGFEPLAPAQCSPDLWSFSSTTKAWTRTAAPIKGTAGRFQPTSTDSIVDSNDEESDQTRWPPAHCGAYSVSGPIPPWHTAASGYADNVPLSSQQIDDYQAAKGVNLRGRSSILLAGGWNGSATSHCITDPTSALERPRAPTVQGSFHPMSSADVINPTGNADPESPTAKCFSATEMWRWEAPRSSVTAA